MMAVTIRRIQQVPATLETLEAKLSHLLAAALRSRLGLSATGDEPLPACQRGHDQDDQDAHLQQI